MSQPAANQDRIAANRRLYGIDRWGDGYFDINEHGHVAVLPAAGVHFDLYRLVEMSRQAGLTLPVLFRFGGILKSRLDRLCGAFEQAVASHGYPGRYRAVYPIKVNQQRSVVSTLVDHGAARFGLEAGSKPELMAVLGVSPRGGLIVCNGYKDAEYIQLALVGQTLGHEIYIVIEKLSELDRVMEIAGEMGVEPRLGLRLRLASLGTGKWRESGGEKSKFGLTAGQLITAADKLGRAGRGHWARLLHVHLGSQIPNLREIRGGVSEAARVLAALRELGLAMDHMDVGGGLGIDYEGTRSRSTCSINYTVEEYADTIVETLGAVCAEAGTEPPHILSESGRAMTAQHAVLVTNVIDVDRFGAREAPAAEAGESRELRGLRAQRDEFQQRSADEVYRETMQRMEEIQAGFAEGRLDLATRARAEALGRHIMREARDRLESSGRARELLDHLKAVCADKLFVNLSIFQSLPDIWAIDQLFPIMPIHRLDQAPERRAILQDLTCDSDGRVDQYVDGEGVEHSLPVHDPGEDEYLLGFFLVGAYQEILGDLHNLFGDTDSVDVLTDREGGPVLGPPRKGDTAEALLAYVHFAPDELRAAYANKVSAAPLSRERRSEYLRLLADGLSGYTYLEP